MKHSLRHIIQVFLIGFSFQLFAQVQTPLDIALRSLSTDFKKYDLLQDDIKDVAVSDNVFTSSNGMSNIYFVQRYQGIEIYNAIMNFSITNDGRVVYVGNRFVRNIATKVNSTKAQIGADEAIMYAVAKLGGNMLLKPRLKESKSDKSFVFEKGSIANSDIAVKLRYQTMKDGSLKLAWDIALDLKGGKDYWSIRIDALTGNIIDKQSFTVHCSLPRNNYTHTEACGNHEIYFPELLNTEQAQKKASTLLLANQYNVFPFPLESPTQGNRKILNNPADPVASPFGWHDTNGVSGNEYTITRGNNVHAYEDRDADYNSSGDEPNGTTNLVFDFPIDLTKEPDQYTKSSTVQLFYAMNFMHDFSYNFGFDEYANFQDYNKPGKGIGNDHIVALSQFDANTLININNADFTSPPDGENGRVRMFLWDNSLSLDKNLIVNAPFNVAGAYTSSVSDFGAVLDYNNPVTGFAIVANDGDKDNPTFACNPLEQGNGADLKGKIAIIDRGGCDYDYKVLNAQNNGAIAVIVCNFAESSSPMGGNLVADQVTIPSVQIKKSDCEKIRIAAGAGGLNITLQGPPPNSSGPVLRDGSLDNGIMAHEFTHGISNRLTGGPSNAGCLTSAEQMGEGWSDFIGLATTVKSWDTKNKIRGFGNYVTKEDSTGKGIRKFPYSTNLNINPHTYADIIDNNEVHYVGEVWNAMLWDLYWAFSDKYGFDPSYKNVNSGSYKAVKLVIDALKIQPCNPGFVDGRDAILAADQLNNGGANECLIWEVFARRGLGQSAKQNDPDITSDAVQNFDTKNTCLNKLDIKKEVSPFINAGEEISCSITVSNFKSVVSNNVVVTDNFPAGTTYVGGSASNGGIVTGDIITFKLGNMAVGQSITMTYKLKSSASIYSTRQYYDNCDQLDNWDIVVKEGSNGWNQITGISHSPTLSFGVADVAQVNRQDLLFKKAIQVQGSRPVLRFYQNYNTEAGADGGYVEISEDGNTYVNAKDLFIRHGYPGKIQYATFVLPNLEAFSGNSNGWVGSYIDLSSYIGKTIKSVRFRYGSDDNKPGMGWYVDDLEYLDLKNYNTEACVTSNSGDMECTKASEEGTIIESHVTATHDLVEGKMEIYPNPASGFINFSLQSQFNGKHQVEIVSLDGKVLKLEAIQLSQGFNEQSVDVSSIPSGCYIIKVQGEKAFYVSKIVVR